jgi:hypothetical protein
VLADSPAAVQNPPVSNSSRKVYAFADDCNIAVLKNVNTVNRIIEVLNSFSPISGLECNIEKSHYLEIGQINNDNSLMGSGLEKKTSLKVLGCVISNDTNEYLTSNAEFVTKKINDQISKWNRFNLSLPGRIRVAKSMLLSQLNYLGSFLNFADQFILRWEQLIGNFVKGNLQISGERITKKSSLGGLGIPKIHDFLDAQKCSWVLRAAKRNDSEWKEVLRKCTINSYFNLDEGMLLQHGALFSGLGTAIYRFRKGYIASNNNYLKVPVLCDPCFSISTRNRNFLKLTDADPAWSEEERQIFMRIKILDLYEGETLLNRAQLTRKLNLHLEPDLYKKLASIAKTRKTRFHHTECLSGISLATFLNGWKKGSKKLRQFISNDNVKYISHNIIKFAQNTDTVIGLDCAIVLNQSWSWSNYSTNIGTFLFKLTNNTLPYNTVLSHFVRGHSRNCTFCDLLNDPDIVDETVLHLFYYCPAVENIRENFFKWLTNDVNFILNRHEFFCCLAGENKCKTYSLMVTIRLFMFYIWECKLRHSLPVLDSVKKFCLREIEVMKKCSKKFNETIINSGVNFSLQRLG